MTGGFELGAYRLKGLGVLGILGDLGALTCSRSSKHFANGAIHSRAASPILPRVSMARTSHEEG